MRHSSSSSGRHFLTPMYGPIPSDLSVAGNHPSTSAGHLRFAQMTVAVYRVPLMKRRPDILIGLPFVGAVSIGFQPMCLTHVP